MQDFDMWFDLFVDKCRELGYNGIIDRPSFLYDFEEGRNYDDVAIEFVKEMNE